MILSFGSIEQRLNCSAHSFGLSRFGSARRIFPRNLFSDSSHQVMSKVQMLLSVLGWCGLTAMGLAIVFQLDSITPLVASVVLVISNALMALFFLGFVVLRKTLPSQSQPYLHWDPEIQRRGMGDLIRSVNHIAIIVADVGRSLAFYIEIIGFQQIQRPNFDRHGAWLTMGNLELHLIKGVPNAPTGRDLIVSHIALETEQPHKVLEKLLEFEVPFRQNISVPDPKKARENLVEAFENSEGKITQYFVRDPDGYYLEICNCDILTAFCLFKEKENAKQKSGHIPKYMQLMDAVLGTYNESGQTKASAFRLPQLFKTYMDPAFFQPHASFFQPHVFFSTSGVFFSTSGVLSLFQPRFFLFFQPHMSFFGPHISSHVLFSTSHIFFSTSNVFLSTLYVSLSTCNVSFPSPLDWFLFGMFSVLWVNVGFLWSAFWQTCHVDDVVRSGLPFACAVFECV